MTAIYTTRIAKFSINLKMGYKKKCYTLLGWHYPDHETRPPQLTFHVKTLWVYTMSHPYMLMVKTAL